MAEKYIVGTEKGKGGWRNGGRKKGKKVGPIKAPTVDFHRRVTPEEKELLEKYLLEIRKKG